MGANSYIRIANTGILPIYTGMDESGRTSMYVKLVRNPKIDFKAKYLIGRTAARTIDDLWLMQISVADERYAGVFKSMINDLIASVKPIQQQNNAEHVLLKRFDEWHTLFAKKIEKKLDFETIVGLAGELHFMNSVLFAKVGLAETLSSWGGPEAENKDFTTSNGWYELKTKGTTKPNIHISSSEQLESEEDGTLVVLPFFKSTRQDGGAYNLMTLYEEISKKLTAEGLQDEFDSKLGLIGFIPDEKYLEPMFKFRPFEYYHVDDSFPHIEAEVQTEAISRIEYDLYLPNIQKYRIGG